MALSDLATFTDWTIAALTEVLDQQVQKFNGASQGTLLLRSGPFPGDFNDAAKWQVLSKLVRRRDPYATGAIDKVSLKHIIDTMVKVAAGTYEVEMDPGQFNWIQRSPDEAGTVLGQQLAVFTMADMLNTALMALVAAIEGIDDLVLDDHTAKFDIGTFNDAQSLFGDRYGDIGCWVMHSSPLFDIFGTAINNSNELFRFESINVRQDGFGRTFVIMDSPSLIDRASPSPMIFNTLGLTSGAVTVEMQDDFTDNVQTTNGDENIKRSYQAEWSYALGVKGFKWDKTHGGKAPTDAEIATTANWDKYVTSNRDTAGVLVKTL